MEGWFPILLSLQNEIFWAGSNSWLSSNQLEQWFFRPVLEWVRLWKHPAKVSNFFKMGSGYTNSDALSTGPLFGEGKDRPTHTHYPKNSQDITGSNLQQNWAIMRGSQSWEAIDLSAITCKYPFQVGQKPKNESWVMVLWPLKKHIKTEGRRRKSCDIPNPYTLSLPKNKFEVHG